MCTQLVQVRRGIFLLILQSNNCVKSNPGYFRQEPGENEWSKKVQCWWWWQWCVMIVTNWKWCDRNLLLRSVHTGTRVASQLWLLIRLMHKRCKINVDFLDRAKYKDREAVYAWHASEDIKVLIVDCEIIVMHKMFIFCLDYIRIRIFEVALNSIIYSCFTLIYIFRIK